MKNNSFKTRSMALLLALTLLFGALPLPARAAHWSDPYMNQLVDWGVMRGDIYGNLNPQRNITRAEFVAMVNRAYGYDELGEMPFTDVRTTDWYFEDISIGYGAGYFLGHTNGTAEPKSVLTREQAAVLLARNMMLQGKTGEALGFSDSRQLKEWSRGLIESVAEAGVITGFEDGSFKPGQAVTRGEVAAMLVKAIGTPIRDAGEYELGSVYGNVTISESGVTLRDTVIVGDLYLTGGVGLGDVTLENVTVYGKIIASGGGVAEKGQSSVTLRNVVADELVVDNLKNQFVTIRAEGYTKIPETNVRTGAYIEDVTPTSYGLDLINLDGEAGMSVQLAGSIAEVVNKTPSSSLYLTQGMAEKVTIDEAAVDSTLHVYADTWIEELNLDVATKVTGAGDVTQLNVNADGSTVDMLPDSITIRPGTTATIAGQVMDAQAAEESSQNPRILSGYPKSKNVASTTADVVFRTNKRGTLYWAVTALTDGSLKEEALIEGNAPAIVSKGVIQVTTSNEDITAALTGLTMNGSYYVSALLEDNRGLRSEVKVSAFTTVDDSVPAFSSEVQPYTILTTNSEDEQVVQLMAQVTKNCYMYYVLLPKGSSQPNENEFKTGAIPGSLGYGVVEMKKNTPTLISQVNSAILKEQTEYVLYLWLEDIDGAKSSSVTSLTVTTKDMTAPVLEHLTVADYGTTSVTLTFAANEPGTLYWAVVKEGESFLKTNANGEPISVHTPEAKIQIVNGVGALGKNSAVARGANTDTRFTVGGLEEEKRYHLYYVFSDEAGNYNVYTSSLTPPMAISTRDETPPTVTQEFSKPGSTDENNLTAYPDTDISLVFSENVQGKVTGIGGKEIWNVFYDIYNDTSMEETARKDALAAALSQHITLYRLDANNLGEPAPVRNSSNSAATDWVVDYRNATVTLNPETDELTITLPYADEDVEDATGTLVNEGKSALNLASGSTYYFVLNNIYDTSQSPKPNLMSNEGDSVVPLPEFRTVFATVSLGVGDTIEIKKSELAADQKKNLPAVDSNDFNSAAEALRVDMSFIMDPVSTDKVDPNTVWDMLLWSDATALFSIYSRTWDETGNAWGDWYFEGEMSARTADAEDGKVFGGLFKYIRGESSYGFLKDFDERTEFAVHVNRIDSSTDFDAWNRDITMGVTVVAGINAAVRLIGGNSLGYVSSLENGLSKGAVSIGVKDPFEVVVPFRDNEPPVLTSVRVIPGDTGATLEVTIDRPGTVYYVVSPVDKTQTGYTSPIMPVKSGNTTPTLDELKTYALDVQDPLAQSAMLAVEQPYVDAVAEGNYTNPVIADNTGQIAANYTRSITLSGLGSEVTYLVYLVTKGISPIYSEVTYCGQFTTLKTDIPILQINMVSTTSANITVNKSSYVSYGLFLTGSLTQSSSAFNKKFSEIADTRWTSSVPQYSADLTVLDAMRIAYVENSVDMGSIFDEYAREDEKATYAELITQATTEGALSAVMKQDNVHFEVLPTANPQSKTELVPMTGMEGTNYYTLLAVARAENSSGYAFRASQPYYNINDDKLVVTSCRLTPNSSTDSTKYTGTLSINFSDILNYRVRDSSTGVDRFYEVDYCVTLDTKHTGSNNVYVDTTTNKGYVNIGSLYTPGKADTSTVEIPTNRASNGHGKAIGTTLEFAMGNVLSGTYITIVPGICGSNRVVREGQSLEVEVRRVATTTTDASGTSTTEYNWTVVYDEVWKTP